MFGTKDFVRKNFRKAEVDAQVILVEGEAEMNSRKAELNRGGRRLTRLRALSLLTFSILIFALKSNVALADDGSPDIAAYSVSAKVQLPPRSDSDKEFVDWNFGHLEQKIAMERMLFQFGSNPRALLEWTALEISKKPEADRAKFEAAMMKAFDAADLSKYPEGSKGKEESKKAFKELVAKEFKLAADDKEKAKGLTDKEKMKKFLLESGLNFSDDKVKELLATLGVTNEDLVAKEKSEREKAARAAEEDALLQRNRAAAILEAAQRQAAVGAAAGAAAGTAANTAGAPAAPQNNTGAAGTPSGSGVPGTEATGGSKVGEQQNDPRVTAAIANACAQIAANKALLDKEADGINQLLAESRQLAAAIGNNRVNNNGQNQLQNALGPIIAKALQDDKRNRDNGFGLNNQNQTPPPFLASNPGNNRGGEQALASPVPDNNNAASNQGTPIQVQVPPPNFAMAPYQPDRTPLPETGAADQIINEGATLAEAVKQNADGSRVEKVMNMTNAKPRDIWKVRSEVSQELNGIDSAISQANAQKEALTANLSAAKEYFQPKDQQKEQQLQQAIQQAQQAASAAPQQGAQLAIQQAQQQAQAQGRDATQQELQQAGAQGQQTYAQAAQTLIAQAQMNYQAFMQDQANRNPALKKIQTKIDALTQTVAKLTASRKADKDELSELDQEYQDAREANKQRLYMAYSGGNPNGGGARPNVNNGGNVNQGMANWSQNAPMRRTGLNQAANPKTTDLSQGQGSGTERRKPLSIGE